MTHTGDDITVGTLLLAEYASLKDEQRSRIAFRDRLIYVTLASAAAVVAATLNAGGHPALLLLLPPVSVLLGWTYLVNDEKVSAAGRYIRTELGPRLALLVAAGDEAVFGWESAHRADSRRPGRKALQLTVDLTTFCGAPVSALTVFWVHGSPPTAWVVVSIVELVAVVVLATHILRYSDLERPRGIFTSGRTRAERVTSRMSDCLTRRRC